MENKDRLKVLRTARRPFLRRTKATAPPDTTALPDSSEEDEDEDDDDREAAQRDAYEAAKKIKAAEASRKEAIASQKEADAFEKEVAATKKEDEASKLEAEAFVREAAERNSTGTTSRPQRRGPNRFKSRKQAGILRKAASEARRDAIASRKEAEASRKEVERNETSVDAGVDTRIGGRRPTVIAAKRNERPPPTANRNFARRRPGGSGGSVSSTLAPSTSSSSSVTRRPYRIASRRRLPGPTPTVRPTTASPTTTSQSTTLPLTTSQPTTLILESEELLQDIGDIDAIEDPTLEPRTVKKIPKTQRRPLVNLKDEQNDQNPSATNEEERTRQSKKYSSTFKQNQLQDILKKSAEDTTDTGFTVEGDAETALALAAHQLITAPLPGTDFGSTGSTGNTEYTSSNTEYTKTPTYEEYTTGFRTIPTQDFIQTTLGETYNIYDTPRVTAVDDTTADITTKSRHPYSTADYEKTTYDAPKTSSFRTSGYDKTDIDAGKVTLETFPTTLSREGYTNTPTDFRSQSPTTFEAPKLSTLSRYPTTPDYQTFTNQYVPTTRDYNNRDYTTRDYTETVDTRTYSTQRTLSPRGFSSPNVITSAYTGYNRRGGFKYGDDKSPTIPENTVKYTTTPIEDTRPTRVRLTQAPEVSGSTVGYTGTSQEPTGYFTRDYLLESPVTKTYDDEYQYLSPTTPQTSTRKVFRKKIQRRISTTLRPTTSTIQPVRSTTPTYVSDVTTPRPSQRPRVSTKKPFEKISKTEPNRTYKPVVNYDYYDDSAEKVALKYAEGTKVILHGKGSIECLDVGNFPHPSSCKKFISCARMEFGSFLGWEYVCPTGLSFDPVGGICNWSAGLGCDEKDD